jgi:hypothetical protein
MLKQYLKYLLAGAIGWGLAVVLQCNFSLKYAHVYQTEHSAESRVFETYAQPIHPSPAFDLFGTDKQGKPEETK